MAATDPRSMGYVLLGEPSRNIATPISVIATTLKQDNAYEALHQGADTWIRCRLTRSTPPSQTLDKVAQSISSNHSSLRVIASLAQFEHSTYGAHFRKQHAGQPLADILTLLTDAELSKPTPRSWALLSKAVFFSTAADLPAVLLDHVYPRFFSWYPHGRITIYLHNPDYERLFAALRVIRCISVYNVSSLQHTPVSLQAWQLDMPFSLFNILLQWGTAITFPYVSGVVLGPSGMPIVFIDDNLAEYQPPVFPISILDLKHAASAFGEERSGLTISGSTASINKTAYYGRYVWDSERSDAHLLLAFIADKSERLLRALSDLGAYERSIDGKVQVDLVFAQEHLWTLGRIIRRTLELQSIESRWIHRLAVFEIADQWGELLTEWKGGDPVLHFRQLLNPLTGKNLVLKCLSKLPPPWNDRFAVECAAAYAHVEHTAIHSVWAKNRLIANAVNIAPDATKPQVESAADFTANLLRDLRNTHHGYMPDKDKARSRLILSTGEWCPALTFLPTLWLLAFLAQPHEFMGWPEAAANSW